MNSVHIPWFKLYIRLRWEGLEHVPESGPAVICPNHASLADPPAIGYPIYFHRGRRVVRYMAVGIHFRGLLGWYMRYYGAIEVAPSRVDPRAFREALGTLRSGRLLGIFPEGERTLDGALLPFQLGAVRIAATAGVPIIPVTLNGTFEIWPRGRRFPRPGRVEIIYHPPITVDPSRRRDKRYLEEVSQKLRDAIGSRLRIAVEDSA
jgi:1-acyl-sn-glycerol-3-phosphate acyltransferase